MTDERNITDFSTCPECGSDRITLDHKFADISYDSVRVSGHCESCGGEYRFYYLPDSMEGYTTLKQKG